MDIKAYFEKAWNFGKTFAPSFEGLGTAGQALNTILTLVIAGVALVIGVYVFSEVEGSMDITDGSTLDNIVGDLYGAYGMTPIVLIVLVAGAIISVLVQFRR